MTRLRLAAAALNTTPLDWATNQRLIRAAIVAAREAGVGILCLPELCITGYGCEDMFLSAGVQRTALESLPQLVAETSGLVTCFGLPLQYQGLIYNTVAVACDGQFLGIVAKQFLAGDGIHYEPRWFKPWPAGAVGSIDVGGKEYPLGDLLFECGGVRVGIEICRDAWVPNRTGAQLAARGADVILNPSASHFAFAKQQIREGFALAATREFGVSFAYSNLLGNEAGRAIFDGGTLIASEGKIILSGPRLSFADWVLSSAVIDVAATRKSRQSPAAASMAAPSEAVSIACGKTITAELAWPSVPANAELTSVRTGILEVSYGEPASDFGELSRGTAGSPQAPWETGPYQKEEEFARAVPLALFDYLRKSHAKGFVVSLSGGADSSVVAVMIHLMIQLAGRELGLTGLRAKLKANVDGDQFNAEVGRRYVGSLLTCVYQSTRNSGECTRAAAEKIAAEVGAEFFQWNVDALVDGYVATVAHEVGRKLTWQQDDVALQNIQARARGPGAWLLANLRSAILLTTSNRSEAAVGYATMDGDTCGGLAPIAGIDKAYLLDWLKWMETTGPAGIGPLPSLAVINSQRPTAELRPPTEDQTDEGDLMPYRVLDAIERAAIRDKLLPIEVFEKMRPQFPQHDAKQLGIWVERFFQLWCKNQWKRERYAPSFHLDDENLDPKTWCRFPILNSGYEMELAELREHVKTMTARA